MAEGKYDNTNSLLLCLCDVHTSNLYLPCKTKQKQYNHSGGLVKSIGAFGISYLIGAKVHSGRISKKMKTKHLKDQKTLYTQYYNDVYRLEEQKAEQQAVIEQLQAALA